MTAGRFAQRMGNKLIQHAEVIGALFWSGQDQRQHLIFIGWIHQNPQQIKQLFRRTHAAREDDDTVCDTDERFQAFFDIRHDDQFIHQRVRRFSRNNGRLSHADKAAVFIALLRVTDRRALHGGFHRPRAAAGADVQLA